MQQLTLWPSQWQQITSLDNLFEAYIKAKKCKTSRPDVANFALNLEPELFTLQQQLVSLTYQPGLYRQFTIYARKPRVISVAPFRDRVVHHALMNVIEPVIEQSLVPYCFACRKRKGVHAAVNYYQQQSRRFAYVLKMDVKRYFPSINHAILKQQYRHLIREENVLWLLDVIVDSNLADVALPIGNLTSQVLANLYLSEVDKVVCAKSRNAYFRYVDDFFVLGNDKAALWRIRDEVLQCLQSLRLQLHSNKSHIFRTNEKVDVLGYKVTKDKRWLRNENGHRFKRKLKNFASQYRSGNLTIQEINPSIQSWIGHAQHAETEGLRVKLFNAVIFQREQT